MEDYGGIKVQEGTFFDMEIQKEVVTVRTGLDYEIENLSIITIPLQKEDNFLQLTIYVRKCGIDWEDLQENRDRLFKDYSYEQVLPEHYKDWYVPVLENDSSYVLPIETN